MEVYPGSIVYSKAGRDKGKYFIVIEKLDDEYVNICDGSMRRMDKPKMKKIKHLDITGAEAKSIIDKINAQKKVTNSDLRKCLSELIEAQKLKK